MHSSTPIDGVHRPPCGHRDEDRPSGRDSERSMRRSTTGLQYLGLSFLPVRPAPTIVTQLVSQLCDQLQGLAS